MLSRRLGPRDGKRSIVMFGSLLAMCALTVACRRDVDPKEDDTTDMADMSAMSGKGDSASTPTSVTFTASQIEHGRVKWAQPGQSLMAGTIEVPGRLVANEDRTARLAAPVQARVLAVHVSPGDRVPQGTRLVTLQSQEASMSQADVAKAIAELSSKRAAAAYALAAKDRAERLLALKAIPRQDYERAIADDELARAGVTQAEAELQRARSTAAQLGVDPRTGSMVLRSPLAGVVTNRDAIPGAVVSAGAALVTVSDPVSLWLTIELPEALASGVNERSSLRFTVAAFPTDTFRAVVQSVSPTFDSVTRTLPVRGVVSNIQRRLRPEMLARVWIQGGARLSVITVPDSAVQRLDGNEVVFVAYPDTNGGARFEKREIETSGHVAGHTAIRRGLLATDAVVLQGAFAVKAQFARAKMPKMEDMEK